MTRFCPDGCWNGEPVKLIYTTGKYNCPECKADWIIKKVGLLEIASVKE